MVSYSYRSPHLGMGILNARQKESLMKKQLAGSLVAFGALVASMALFAQAAPGKAPAAKQTQEEKEIAAMRKDIRAQRKQYISSAMPLTPQEGQAFWPVYDQYVAEIMKIGDRRIASLKQFGATQNTMNSEQAVKWIQEVIEQDKAMVDLRLKYIPIVAKVLPGKKAAMFFNLDRRTQMMVDLDLPLK